MQHETYPHIHKHHTKENVRYFVRQERKSHGKCHGRKVLKDSQATNYGYTIGKKVRQLITVIQ